MKIMQLMCRYNVHPKNVKEYCALVRTTKSEIDDFLKGEKIGKARDSKSEIDALCAMKGVEVGRNVEICKGIHAETVSEDLRLQ